MRIAIPKERRPDEARVAATPDSVKRLIGLGCEVAVEAGAGAGANFTDAAYEAAGASIAKDAKATLAGADFVLKVQRPITSGKHSELSHYAKGTHLAAILDPMRARDDLAAVAKAGVTAFALDLMPRITRAQAMDVLSSQANLAGYKAVIEAAAAFGRAFPMMMTAAGTVAPARVLVMGAGVAGLQAIATGRRLGAIVAATDVRPAAKQEVESLGADFIAVEDAEFQQAQTAGGYAKEMSEEYKKKQAELIAETIKKQDIVITAALIPGRPAPKLVSADMVKSMKPGSVIVDLAVETGGNCELSEMGKVVTRHGITIIGHANMASRLANDTSQLYARNLFNFMTLMVDQERKALAIDWEDEIIKGSCVTRDGAIVHPALAEAAPQKPKAKKPKAEKPKAKKTAKPAAKKKAAKKKAAKKSDGGAAAAEKKPNKTPAADAPAATKTDSEEGTQS